MLQHDNTRVSEFVSLPSPATLKSQVFVSEKQLAQIAKHRQEIRGLLAGTDARPLCIVGPCSIHDVKAGKIYAERLAALRKRLGDRLAIVMRVYFEKPRTTVGWKGLINDPHLDGTHDLNTGLRMAREFLRDVAELDLPAATEFLDPIVPQYIADLISWVAIGARTTESQTHREMASGLSMPVGFKNATDGSLQVALDAMTSARSPHHFLGIDLQGMTAIVKTCGNPDVHVILRGGASGSNYSPSHIADCLNRLKHKPGETKRLIMVDCSHGNSDKDYRRQPLVFRSVLDQILNGQPEILGFMLESHLKEGKQDLKNLPLAEGQSITDGCISWEQTEELLTEAWKKLA